MIIASTAETVSTIAAVVTVALAAFTVWLTRKMRTESTTAHNEEMTEERALIAEFQQARADAQAAHAKETRQAGEMLDGIAAARKATTIEARHAADHAQAIERVNALGRIAGALREIATHARTEVGATFSIHSPVLALALYAEAETTLYRALGGERQEGQPVTAAIYELTARARNQNTPPSDTRTRAEDLLKAINHLAAEEAVTFGGIADSRRYRETGD